MTLYTSRAYPIAPRVNETSPTFWPSITSLGFSRPRLPRNLWAATTLPSHRLPELPSPVTVSSVTDRGNRSFSELSFAVCDALHRRSFPCSSPLNSRRRRGSRPRSVEMFSAPPAFPRYGDPVCAECYLIPPLSPCFSAAGPKFHFDGLLDFFSKPCVSSNNTRRSNILLPLRS